MEQIIVNKISKIYNEGQQNEVRALDEVSFSLEEGEFVIVLGHSGAGKSTLLNILGGMDDITKGEYLIRGEDVSKYNSKQLSRFRRKDIGFVFQFYNLMPNLTALENIELAASVADSPFDAKEILTKVGLANRANNFPSELSGGEQQRVAIARAIVKNPTLLLCDEPTGALDSKTGTQIIELLHQVASDYKKTVIIVTHNSKISECASRLIRIKDGKIASDEKIENPKKPTEVIW